MFRPYMIALFAVLLSLSGHESLAAYQPDIQEKGKIPPKITGRLPIKIWTEAEVFSGFEKIRKRKITAYERQHKDLSLAHLYGRMQDYRTALNHYKNFIDQQKPDKKQRLFIERLKSRLLEQTTWKLFVKKGNTETDFCSLKEIHFLKNPAHGNSETKNKLYILYERYFFLMPEKNLQACMTPEEIDRIKSALQTRQERGGTDDLFYLKLQILTGEALATYRKIRQISKQDPKAYLDEYDQIMLDILSLKLPEVKTTSPAILEEISSRRLFQPSRHNQ